VVVAVATVVVVAAAAAGGGGGGLNLASTQGLLFSGSSGHKLNKAAPLLEQYRQENVFPPGQEIFACHIDIGSGLAFLSQHIQMVYKQQGLRDLRDIEKERERGRERERECKPELIEIQKAVEPCTLLDCASPSAGRSSNPPEGPWNKRRKRPCLIHVALAALPALAPALCEGSWFKHLATSFRSASSVPWPNLGAVSQVSTGQLHHLHLKLPPVFQTHF
jgi:hypothetical protein